MILVLLTVEACCQCSIVGDKLKVDSHLAFEQPCEWVEPKADAEEFGKQNVERVLLPTMCLLMYQYLLQFLTVVFCRIDEYPVEE